MPKTKYTKADYDAVLDRVREGMSLRKACEPSHLPSAPSVCERVADNSAFAEQYARARETRTEGMFEDILDIADDAGLDPKDRRVRIDTRKWMLGKMAPKRYGDKVSLEHTGEGGGPIRHEVMSWLGDAD